MDQQSWFTELKLDSEDESYEIDPRWPGAKIE